MNENEVLVEMERRVKGNFHARCGTGENLAITSKDYLSLSTVISKQGVLVGLNSLLDNCKAIQLVTGEVIERHPDTVIVITTNTEYNGCREMNRATRSVLKRYGTSY